MAHFPKPFFRPARAVWYVQIDGKQVNLGADKTEAFKAYHGLMQHRAEAKAEQPAPLPSLRRLVVVIVDDYLEWCQKHRAPATYEWYRDRLEAFCKTIEPTLSVDQLKPHHVQKWVDGYRHGAPPMRYGASNGWAVRDAPQIAPPRFSQRQRIDRAVRGLAGARSLRTGPRS